MIRFSNTFHISFDFEDKALGAWRIGFDLQIRAETVLI